MIRCNPSELRKAMRKSPSLKLWDKTLKSWTNEDYTNFQKVLNSDVEILESKKRKVKSGLKVMRISDGKIYDSVKSCRGENGFYSDQMTAKLKLGIEFKRI
jgi:hypothetical protein